jgi:hypothetical protein
MSVWLKDKLCKLRLISHRKKDLITVYRNRNEKHYHLLLEQYFYCVFIDSTYSTNRERKTLVLANTAS